MSECKDVCKRFRGLKPKGKAGRYETGQKRCGNCKIFIVFNGNRCPCCRGKLRGTPKSAKYRKQLRIARGID